MLSNRLLMSVQQLGAVMHGPRSRRRSRKAMSAVDLLLLPHGGDAGGKGASPWGWALRLLGVMGGVVLATTEAFLRLTAWGASPHGIMGWPADALAPPERFGYRREARRR
jgi:hypothetical protein